MQSILAKCAAVVVGVLLLLFAVAMLMEGSGFVQSGRNNALAYIIGVLGLGLIATAFFGDTLKYHGEGAGPLGKIIATGGAAVFVIGLVFILSTEDGPARTEGATEAAAPAETPEVQPTEEESSPATPELSAADEQSSALPPPPTGPATQPGPAARNPLSADMRGQGYHFAWTYCSTCCPQGPDACPHTAWGAGATAEQAAATAVLYCSASGGYEQSCRANVQFVSEEELAL